MNIRPNPFSGMILVLLSGIFFGTLAIFAALLSLTRMDPLDQVAWRYLLTIPVFFSIVVVNKLRGKSWLLPGSKTVPVFIGQGFLLFLASTTLVATIELGMPANVVGFLANISPIFTLLISRLFFHERIQPIKIVATLVSILGASLLILGSSSVGLYIFLRPAAIIGVSSSLFFGAFVVTNGRLSSSTFRYDSYAILFWTFLGTSFFSVITLFSYKFLIGATVLTTFLVPQFTVYQWELLVGFSLFSTTIPYLFLTLGERSIEGTTASIILLAAPICNVVLSIFVLGEYMNVVEIIGGLLVTFGIILVSYRKKEKKQELFVP